MDSKNANLEERLKSLLVQLISESAIFERIIYKNKNQHRRSPYFQALLKVRRDLRLLQSAELGQILNAFVSTIKETGYVDLARWPKNNQKMCLRGKHTYQNRLLGVARLLSQMVEPILNAAIQISLLLAKSFFMGFSLIVLSCLARLRVLVQQGATTTCYVALHPIVKGVTGKYLNNSNIGEPSSKAKDVEMAKKLWDFSMELIR